MQEGGEGRSDALLVSQFGFTRGGAVSRVDLDPTPRLPSLFAAVGGPADGGRGGAGAGGGLLSGRTQPRLTGTWAGPLLWPNEVNQVMEQRMRTTIGLFFVRCVFRCRRRGGGVAGGFRSTARRIQPQKCCFFFWSQRCEGFVGLQL